MFPRLSEATCHFARSIGEAAHMGAGGNLAGSPQANTEVPGSLLDQREGSAVNIPLLQSKYLMRPRSRNSERTMVDYFAVL
jgi:hypothetical protein